MDKTFQLVGVGFLKTDAHDVNAQKDTKNKDAIWNPRAVCHMISFLDDCEYVEEEQKSPMSCLLLQLQDGDSFLPESPDDDDEDKEVQVSLYWLE